MFDCDNCCQLHNFNFCGMITWLSGESPELHFQKLLDHKHSNNQLLYFRIYYFMVILHSVTKYGLKIAQIIVLK